MKRIVLLLGACLALAALVAVTSGFITPPIANGAPSVTKRCWPGDRYGNNNDVPRSVKHPERYASCDDCRPIASGTKCELWYGGQTAGGGESVSHKGWPGLTGIRWQVIANGNRGEIMTGSKFNDELLGRNGSDQLAGRAGNDVIWGDSNIALNGTKQRERLNGGDGNDWIYTSKGLNTVKGGAGNDHIFAYNGHGSVDCGSGRHDVVTITMTKHTRYKLKNCEVHRKAGS